MKILLSISLCMITLQTIKAQDDLEWAPLGATWHYTFWNPPHQYYMTLEAIGDTVINDTTARVLKQTVYRGEGPPTASRSNIYIYPDGDKVYYWAQDSFTVLYDFTASVGDTLEIIAPVYEWYDRGSTMYFRVDSVEKIIVEDKVLRRQYLRAFERGAKEYAFQFSGWHFEIFGCDKFFIPLNGLECDGGCPEGLRCYSDNRFSVMFTHQPSANVPCERIVIIVSAEEQTLRENQVVVFPNPSRGNPVRIHIRSPGPSGESVYYQVVDLSGRKVAEETVVRGGNEPWRLYLKPGVYILTVQGKNWWDTEKIVVY